jgi:anti-sigma B factor antagonist
MAQTVSLSSDRIGDHGEVLTLDGKCDLSTALLAEQRIVAALDAGTTEIIFDLRGVTSLGVSMLHVLFRGLIQIKGQNGRLVLVRPNAHVWALFEQNGLDRGFSSFPDLTGALAASANPRFAGSVAAQRWLDDGGSFSSEAVARAQDEPGGRTQPE